MAQQTRDLEGTGTRTDGNKVVLRWNKGADQLTIPLSPTNNVATFHLAPGFNQHQTFCMEAEVTKEDDKLPTIVKWQTEDLHPLDTPIPAHTGSHKWETNSVDFELGSRSIKSMKKDKDDATMKLEAEFLQCHFDHAHMHPDRLRLMSKQGILPRKFINARFPFCAACAHGKATRRPWRSKIVNNKDEAYIPTKPGELISVDQLMSPTHGIIAKMTGILTSKRYTCATI